MQSDISEPIASILATQGPVALNTSAALHATLFMLIIGGRRDCFLITYAYYYYSE